MIDNYSTSFQPYNLNWGGSAVLDCTPITLLVSLLEFKGFNVPGKNVLEWSSASPRLINLVNTLGQEISKDSKGLIFEIYSDGSRVKKFNQ